MEIDRCSFTHFLEVTGGSVVSVADLSRPSLQLRFQLGGPSQFQLVIS